MSVKSADKMSERFTLGCKKLEIKELQERRAGECRKTLHNNDGVNDSGMTCYDGDVCSLTVAVGWADAWPLQIG